MHRQGLADLHVAYGVRSMVVCLVSMCRQGLADLHVAYGVRSMVVCLMGVRFPFSFLAPSQLCSCFFPEFIWVSGGAPEDFSYCLLIFAAFFFQLSGVDLGLNIPDLFFRPRRSPSRSEAGRCGLGDLAGHVPRHHGIVFSCFFFFSFFSLLTTPRLRAGGGVDNLASHATLHTGMCYRICCVFLSCRSPPPAQSRGRSGWYRSLIPSCRTTAVAFFRVLSFSETRVHPNAPPTSLGMWRSSWRGPVFPFLFPSASREIFAPSRRSSRW